MSSHRPVVTHDEHRVLKFRPRSSDELRDDVAAAPVESDEPDDFKQRMWVNAAALAFTASLVAFGIWLAVSISDMRKTQDCVLMGRRDCARVAPPPTATSSSEPATRRH